MNLRVRGRKTDVPERERELHKDLPHPDPGMVRTLRAYPRRASILVTACWLSDDECEKYRGRNKGIA